MQSKKPIRILTVDDHPILREGIGAIIENESDMALAGEAVNGLDAIEQFRKLLPDVVLMDLQMPKMDGLEAIKAIRAEFPDARVIVLTTYAGDAQALKALQAGAQGYLLKSSLRRDLLETIRAIHAGRRHIPADIASEIAFHAADEALTDRELNVLRLVADGKSNKEIARLLAISDETIKGHLKNIFAKLNVTDRTQAVTIALRRGVLSL